jgi:hypothetical protein
MAMTAVACDRPARGGAYLGLAMIIAVVGLGFIYGGAAVRDRIGRIALSADEGSEPPSAVGVHVAIASIGHRDDMPVAACVVAGPAAADPERQATDGQSAAPAPAEPPAARLVATEVDEGDAAFNAGLQAYVKAQALGPVPERNRLYAEAAGHFDRAARIYARLLAKDPSNQALQTKLVQANKLKFGGIHYQAAF